MKHYRAEFHVHTVLSPCAEVEMIPPLIVQGAIDQGINLIAITDHNSSANIWAVQKAAKDFDLTVLPGMEIQTREEVHSLCLFDTLEQIEAFQKFVDSHLPSIENDADFFGEQFVVDETGDYIRRETQLLLTSVAASIEEAFTEVTKLEGMFIPAHVNRKAFGLFENLGLIPKGLSLEALEISRHIKKEAAIQQFPELKSYPLLKGGDVHRLDEFLGANVLDLAEPSIRELHFALRNLEGRSFCLRDPDC